MGEQEPQAPQQALNAQQVQGQGAAPPSGSQPATGQSTGVQGGSTSSGKLPYQPQPRLAAILLAAALVIIIGTGVWYMAEKQPPGYTGGGAAAAAGILFVLAMILEWPALIMDDSVEAGGEPSTMRIMALAIVLTFCLVMLRTGWNSGALPSLENQGNWVWLVTAALGGKALQKFAEVQDKN